MGAKKNGKSDTGIFQRLQPLKMLESRQLKVVHENGSMDGSCISLIIIFLFNILHLWHFKGLVVERKALARFPIFLGTHLRGSGSVVLQSAARAAQGPGLSG